MYRIWDIYVPYMGHTLTMYGTPLDQSHVKTWFHVCHLYVTCMSFVCNIYAPNRMLNVCGPCMSSRMSHVDAMFHGIKSIMSYFSSFHALCITVHTCAHTHSTHLGQILKM